MYPGGPPWHHQAHVPGYNNHHHYHNYNYKVFTSPFRRGGRGPSMVGRFFFFLVGMYAGVVANQRYRVPHAPTPGEAWREMWEKPSSYQGDRCGDERHQGRYGGQGQGRGDRWGRWGEDQGEGQDRGRRSHWDWGSRRGPQPSAENERAGIEMPQELRDAIDKLKALERKYRRHSPGDGSISTTTGNSGGIQNSESGGSVSTENTVNVGATQVGGEALSGQQA